MKTLRILAVLLAVLPTLSLAGGKLSTNELKYLVKTCFSSFYHPGGKPFQVDRPRFRSMGFTTIKDDRGKFEAYRLLSEKSVGFKHARFGPRIEIRRNKRNPDKLLHKSCTITGDKLSGGAAFITNVSSRQVQSVLHAEAKRLGFKPFKNRKGKVVWIKGDIAVFLDVTFSFAAGGVLGDQPPSVIYVDGVHPKDLRGITQ